MPFLTVIHIPFTVFVLYFANPTKSEIIFGENSKDVLGNAEGPGAFT